MDKPETCPGCDGSIMRAIQQGREVTTYERCEGCEKREEALMAKFREVIVSNRFAGARGAIGRDPRDLV